MANGDVLRSEATLSRYRANRAKGADYSFIERADQKQFRYWVMIRNDFPYDKVAESHMLLFPKRKVTEEWELTTKERKELWDIKRVYGKVFDAFIENFPKNRTLPGHLHFHLISYKNISKI